MTNLRKHEKRQHRCSLGACRVCPVPDSIRAVMDENIRLKKSVGELSALATANARQALRRQVNMQTLTITQVSCSCILSKFSNNFYPMQLFQNDEAIKHYTQFASFAALKTFYDGLPKPARTQARTLSQLNEFVLTLMKLRRIRPARDYGERCSRPDKSI